ncbi:MAG: CvpA family protein [Prevotellaceae bacterium]|jgi:membrane protein required for colicin V production|nr:CvpA family protein [Prevotellaceae bacterium]
MNIIDLVILAILIWSIVSGFSKGFVVQVFSLAALFIGVYCAYKLSGFVAGFISESLSTDPTFTDIIAFTITLVGVWILIYMLGKIVHQIVQTVMLGLVNRILGAAFAFLKITLILSILFIVFENLNTGMKMVSQETIDKSFTYKPLKKVGVFIFPYLTFGKEEQEEE